MQAWRRSGTFAGKREPEKALLPFLMRIRCRLRYRTTSDRARRNFPPMNPADATCCLPPSLACRTLYSYSRGIRDAIRDRSWVCTTGIGDVVIDRSVLKQQNARQHRDSPFSAFARRRRSRVYRVVIEEEPSRAFRAIVDVEYRP